MSDAAIRLGIVGAGRIAEAHAGAFAGLAGVRLACVVDPKLDRALDLARRTGALACDGIEAMPSGKGLDAVVLCTPPDTHAALAVTLLERGLHVLCEKPLAVGIRAAEHMLAASRRAGRLLVMASKYRFVDDVVRARELVVQGVVGTPLLYENAFLARMDMAARWNSDPLLAGGGVVADNGAHAAELVRFLIGPISEVHTAESSRPRALPVEETALVTARAGQGVLACIVLSWSFDPGQDWYVRIHGSDGTISIGWKESWYALRSAERVVFGVGYDKQRAFQRQLLSFVDAIRGGAPFPVTDADALDSVRAVDAAYRSLASGSWTKLTS